MSTSTIPQLDADRIAHSLSDKPKRSGDSWRVPCPAHGGDGPNLSLRNGDGGRLLTFCHSRGCSFKDIIAALRDRRIVGDFERSWTYPADRKGVQKVVTRRDFVDQSGQADKSIKSPGKQNGTPLLLLGDEGECPIVIVEGEAKADDLYEAIYIDEGFRLPVHAVASYPHGSGSADKADYSVVKGRKVIVWPDPDETGQEAGRKVWKACSSAGAAELWLIRGPAPDDLNVADKLAALGSAELLFERAKLGMTVRELYAIKPNTPMSNGQKIKELHGCNEGKPKAKKKVQPIIARDDQEGRHLDDGTCHVEDCPCDDCAAAARADLVRYAEVTETELEPVEDPQDRADRIIAAWGEMDINQRDLANMFVTRYDGQWVDQREYGAFRQEYRFDSRRGRWMEFKAGHWTEADTIYDALGGLIERLCGDKPSLASKWSKVNVYKDVLTLAKEHLTIEKWDTEGDLMGLPNGELWDLETGYSMPNFRRWHITKTTGVDPAEYQSKSIWRSFLSDVTGGDLDMQEGLQISVGASLFGGNRDHRLNVVCGDGGTGKGVFLNTLTKALGDYAGAMPASVLAGKGNDHPTGLAGVVDKRFVAVQEVNAETWKEETLKTITGGDTMPVRFMRQDFFVVQPQCTLWVSSNAPPALRMVDNAIKRRLRIWPFEHKPTEVDTRLSEKLQEPAMLGQVLQWALLGAEMYARLSGEIEDCDAVIQATKDYFIDVDTIGAWLEACTTPSQIPELDTGAAAAFKHYSAWCESEGQRPTTRTSWECR